MSRTIHLTDQDLPPGRYTWGKPGRGKYYKKLYNRAVRRAAKGTGKTRSVAGYASELNYKGT